MTREEKDCQYELVLVRCILVIFISVFIYSVIILSLKYIFTLNFSVEIPGIIFSSGLAIYSIIYCFKNIDKIKKEDLDEDI